MKLRIKHAVRQWLRMERQGRSEQSDRALQKVFSLLPLEPIPDGFTERLLARAGLAPVRSSDYRWAAAWGLRAGVSLCLVLTALFLLVLPSYVPALLGIFNMGRATELGVNALVGVLQQLGIGLVVWRALSAAGSILSSVLSSPPYLAALFTGVLLSFGALRVLNDVILSERRSRYVGPV